MPKITIVRPNEWANQSKYINIYINDVKAGRIGINQTAHFDVLAGKNKVVLRNRWFGGSMPLTVDLSKGEDKAFEISSNQYTLCILPLFYVIASSLYYGAVSIFNLKSTFLTNAIGLGLIYLTLFFPFYNRYYMRLKEVGKNAFKKTRKEEQARLIRKIMEADEKDGLYET